ncbi:MAG: protein phosphatase 2C domain-containing protein [Herminiimonas sp.]|nr:protein phosphatase 2C domain-containing protein [Herminiimonas sp.]
MGIDHNLLASLVRDALARLPDGIDAASVDAFFSSAFFTRFATRVDEELDKAISEFRLTPPTSEKPDKATTAIDDVPDISVHPTQPDPSIPMIAFRLPNARAGSTYSHQLELQTPSPLTVSYVDIVLPIGLDMAVDLVSGTLSGTPGTAGEFDIGIVYVLTGKDGNATAETRSARVSLLVNPDPKLMWKNLPSDQSDPFWKPDEEYASRAGAGFDLVAASKRGRSHAHVGSFRDDDFLIDTVDATGWAIAVVSDGAGSAQYSRRGSQIICQRAGAYLKHVLGGTAAADLDAATEELHHARTAQPGDAARIDAASLQLHARLVATVGHAAHEAVKALHAEVAGRPETGVSYRDFSSTAIIAACRRFSFGTLCVAYWVGDGAVGVYGNDTGITLLGDADSGEYSGQTRFLDNAEVSADALARRTRFALVGDMTALILMTDGVSDARFDAEVHLTRRQPWDELWQELDTAAFIGDYGDDTTARLLAWLDFWSQGNHDDRTIALVLPSR